MVGAAAAGLAAGNAASPLSLGNPAAGTAAVAALVEDIAEDLPGFGCAAPAPENLAGGSVIEDPAGTIADESAAESLLYTAGFDKVVPALAAAAAAAAALAAVLAAAVVAARVKESLGKQEDRHQH
jgi:hypothetical protein